MGSDNDKPTNSHLLNHPSVIPWLHMLLWLIGIVLGALNLLTVPEISESAAKIHEASQTPIPISLENKILIERIFFSGLIVYVVFLGECIINLFDTACVYKEMQFGVTLIYLLIKVLLSVVATGVLTYLFFRCPDFDWLWGCLGVATMCWLKFMSTHFMNNIGSHLALFNVGSSKSQF